MKDTSANVSKKVSRKIKSHGAVRILSQDELAAFAASRGLSVTASK